MSASIERLFRTHKAVCSEELKRPLIAISVAVRIEHTEGHKPVPRCGDELTGAKLAAIALAWGRLRQSRATRRDDPKVVRSFAVKGAIQNAAGQSAVSDEITLLKQASKAVGELAYPILVTWCGYDAHALYSRGFAREWMSAGWVRPRGRESTLLRAVRRLPKFAAASRPHKNLRRHLNTRLRISGCCCQGTSRGWNA